MRASKTNDTSTHGTPRKPVAEWMFPIVLGLVLLVIALPLAYALRGSLAPEAQLFDRSPLALLASGDVVVDHYLALFSQREFLGPIVNSLVVASCTTLLSISLGALCAYALARLHFRGRGLLLAGVLGISMFPQIAIVSPLYLMLRELRLIDTYPGLLLPYLTFATPLAIWLLFGFFRQLPKAIEEAARIDGANRLRVLVEIVAPLSLPALVTTAVLVFIYSWNEFLFALSFTLSPEMHTVPVAIALFRGQYQVPWGQVLAGAAVSTSPVALLVFIFQRRITQGLVSGAVKG
jgi:ABC-type glycerol-3-phosphate transport system permease component